MNVKAYTGVVTLDQNLWINEQGYFNMLWDKALRLETVFFDRRLNLLFIDVILRVVRAQVCQYLSTNPGRSCYDAVPFGNA